MLRILRVLPLLALFGAGAAQADYLWLQRDGASMRVQAGQLHKPLAVLPALQAPRALWAEGRELPVVAQANALVLAPPAAGDLRFSASLPGEQGVFTYHHARFGRSETRAVNLLELVPTQAEGNSFRLMFQGRPVAASQVHVDTSQGWMRTLVPDRDGTVMLATPFPGLYVLEVTARLDNGSVVLDGKTYLDVRHTATLSFEVR